MNPQFYQQLLALPLFQGMSRGDLEEVVAQTRFGFTKHKKNKVVANEGDACAHLLFLMKGTLLAECYADDRSYSVAEEMTAPAVLQAERLFGLTQRYTHTFTTKTECGFIRLDKAETLRLAERYEIFRLNLLNLVTTQSQRLTRMPWRSHPQGTRQKIVRFFESHCMRPVGAKRFRIRMEVLARETGESRIHVSQVLHDMQSEGLLSFSRGIIDVPAFELLLAGI